RHGPASAQAGMGNDAARPPEPPARSGAGALRIAVNRDAAAHGQRARAVGRHLGHEPIEPVGAPRGKHHGGARAGELASQRFADARRGASDQRNLVFERGQGDASVIASSAYAEAVFALRTASPWAFLIIAFSWGALASPTSVLA